MFAKTAIKLDTDPPMLFITYYNVVRLHQIWKISSIMKGHYLTIDYFCAKVQKRGQMKLPECGHEVPLT